MNWNLRFLCYRLSLIMVKVLRDVGLNYILLSPGSRVIHCWEHGAAVLSLVITNLHFCKLGSASQQTKNYVLLFSLQTCWRSTDQLRVGYFVWSDEAGTGAGRWGLDGLYYHVCCILLPALSLIMHTTFPQYPKRLILELGLNMICVRAGCSRRYRCVLVSVTFSSRWCATSKS